MAQILQIIKDQHLTAYPTFTKSTATDTETGQVYIRAGQAVQWTSASGRQSGYVVALDPGSVRPNGGPLVLVINKQGRYDRVRLFKLSKSRAAALSVIEAEPRRAEKAAAPPQETPPPTPPPSEKEQKSASSVTVASDCSPGEIFCAETVVITPAKQIPARFAVFEADSLITSHKPGTFKEDPRYPRGCQQRDYSLDATEQHKVNMIASNLKPTFLINHTPSAVDGAPVVNTGGVVLGGNGRLMGLKLAYSMGKATAYRDYLQRVAAAFGTTPAAVGRLQQPVLVRMVDVDMSACATYSNILNTAMTQKVGFTDFIVSMSRQLTDADLVEFGQILDDADVTTVSQLTSRPASVRAIRDIFTRRNIITPQNTSEFFDPSSPSDFSELGDLLVSRIVLAAILPDKALIEAATSYTEKVFKVLPDMVKIRSLPPKHTFIQDLQEAIRSERARRKSGLQKAHYLSQGDMFSGGTPADNLTAEQMTMWDKLDGPVTEWKAYVKNYIAMIPKTEILAHRDNMDTMFEEQEDPPEEPEPAPEAVQEPTPETEPTVEPEPDDEDDEDDENDDSEPPRTVKAFGERKNVIIDDELWIGLPVVGERYSYWQFTSVDVLLPNGKKEVVVPRQLRPFYPETHGAMIGQSVSPWRYLSVGGHTNIHQRAVWAWSRSTMSADRAARSTVISAEEWREEIYKELKIKACKYRYPMAEFEKLWHEALLKVNSLFFGWLHSYTSVTNWMVVGPANYNIPREEKRRRAAEKREEEYSQRMKRTPEMIERVMRGPGDAGLAHLERFGRIGELSNRLYAAYIASITTPAIPKAVVVDPKQLGITAAAEDLEDARELVECFVRAHADDIIDTEYFTALEVFSEAELKEYREELNRQKRKQEIISERVGAGWDLNNRFPFAGGHLVIDMEADRMKRGRQDEDLF